jgi:hypothetical protein
MDQAAMTADVLLTDLLSASGEFMAASLNGLREEQRQAIGDALARGGELQLRVAAGSVSRVEICIANGNGEAAEVMRVLCTSIDCMH